MPVEVSRPDKLDDGQTILYEIDMLRFAERELLKDHLRGEVRWMYLECFLVHFRNLIEFLGKNADEVRDTDLHVTTIWWRVRVPQPGRLDGIHNDAKVLWQKYERQQERISRYLQHCTTYRTDVKSWNVTEMTNEIEPLLGEIDVAFGRPELMPQSSIISGPESSNTVSDPLWVGSPRRYLGQS